jgi:hypothetical protein
MDLRNLRKSASKKDPLNPRKKQHLIKKSSINMIKLLADNECIKKSYIGELRGSFSTATSLGHQDSPLHPLS